MSLVSVSIVNVALPSIEHSLHASHSDLQWVLSGYALTFGVVLVAAGARAIFLAVVDFYRRRAGVYQLVGGGGLSAIAKLVKWCALYAEGIGSGLINPQGLGMIQHSIFAAQSVAALLVLAAWWACRWPLAPVVGGVLIELGGADLGWRLAFLVNVPVAAVIIFLAWRWFPRPLIGFHYDGQGAAKWLKALALDPIGSLLLGLAVLCGLLPLWKLM